jgi:hypothetical protein
MNKVENMTTLPYPLPSRDGEYYTVPSPLVGEGKGEGVLQANDYNDDYFNERYKGGAYV